MSVQDLITGLQRFNPQSEVRFHARIEVSIEAPTSESFDSDFHQHADLTLKTVSVTSKHPTIVDINLS